MQGGPRCQADFTMLKLLRSNASLIVTSSSNLTAEPNERYLVDPSLRFTAVDPFPRIIVVSNSSRSLPRHSLLNCENMHILSYGSGTLPSIYSSSRIQGGRIRSILPWVYRNTRNLILFEVGPTITQDWHIMDCGPDWIFLTEYTGKHECSVVAPVTSQAALDSHYDLVAQVSPKDDWTIWFWKRRYPLIKLEN